MAKDAVTEAFIDSKNQSQPWSFNMAAATIVNGRIWRSTPGVPAAENINFYDVVILDPNNNEINLNETGSGNPIRPYLFGVRSTTVLSVGALVQVSRGTAVSSAPEVVEAGDTEDYKQFCPSTDHKIFSSGGGASCFQSYTEWGAHFG